MPRGRYNPLPKNTDIIEWIFKREEQYGRDLRDGYSIVVASSFVYHKNSYIPKIAHG